MEKTYNPQDHEDNIAHYWDKAGFANPDNLPDDRSEPFCIALPPPNATGTLHLGHAVYVIQDIMVRHARMNGKKALWVPGTDHAAIATQSKVEDIIYKEENKTRHDLGRDELMRRIEIFVEESKATIRHQLKKMGFSLDWSRERFTLEPMLAEAVQTMFMRMANDGLVYRGDRIVNWDPKLQTTVADDEQEYKEVQAPFYYFQYGPFVIGTARPETKFGDKYVVIHPDDERYADYIHGQHLELEWINGPITATVIKDESVDPEFGSGVMTITPWHDTIDFDIAERHQLDKEQIIGYDGKLLPVSEEFAGMTIAEARPRIVEKLQQKGLLVRIDEQYTHRVAVSYRGGGIIEPQIMKQWFVAVDKPVVDWKGKKRSLKEVAIDVVESEDIAVVPERFTKMYFHWMNNLHDWCISRQLWYGHRIPAWYAADDTEKKHPLIQVDSPGEGYVQDEDVLDTWFSSGMWTFSIFDWVNNFDFEKRKARPGSDLAFYHPTDVLETGYDILFFWVARMILMTTYGMGQIPFRKVYLHGLVRDREGQKMSKSKGNGIDPLEMSEKYGTDAVRLSLVIGSTPGNDSRLYEEKIAGYRNFVNKLWNVSRFITMNEEQKDTTVQDSPSYPDAWILSKLHSTLRAVNEEYANDQYGLAGDRLYNFLWHEFADWYIEMSKISELHCVKQKEVLHTLLKMLHPMIPFVTETLAQETGLTQQAGSLMVQAWPQVEERLINEEQEKRFDTLRELITAIRHVRREYRLPPSQTLEVLLEGEQMQEQERMIFERLARVECVQEKSYQRSAAVVEGGFRCIIPLDEVIDVEKEKERLQKEVQELEQYIRGLEGKLQNEQFVQHAPTELVEQTKKLHVEKTEALTHLREALQALSS